MKFKQVLKVCLIACVFTAFLRAQPDENIPIATHRLSDRILILSETLMSNNVVAVASEKGIVVVDTFLPHSVDSIACKSISAAAVPTSQFGCATVVSGGLLMDAARRSSKPTTATSLGTCFPASLRPAMNPNAVTSVYACTASGTGFICRKLRAALRPFTNCDSCRHSLLSGIMS